MAPRRLPVGSDSPYLSRFDPIARRRFEIGDMIVMCDEGHAYLEETWEQLDGQCPICRYESTAETTLQVNATRRGLPISGRASLLGSSTTTVLLGILVGVALAIAIVIGIGLTITLLGGGPGQVAALEAPADVQEDVSTPAPIDPSVEVPTADPAAVDAATLSTPDPIRPTAEALLSAGNALAGYSIPALIVREYDGGAIQKLELRYRDADYDQWSMEYMCDGLRLTGLVNIPTSDSGPWPVALVLHGGIDQSVYAQGDGTRNHADILARAGYIAFMPDYRSYNNTEGSGSPLKIPWAIDVMCLIDALPTLPEADPERIGVLGHSRGGGIASYLMVISDEIDAVALYAPLHSNQAIVWQRYDQVFDSTWPRFDAEVVGSPEANPDGYAMVSPSSYLELTSMPVQIHHGGEDSVLPVEWSRGLYETMLALGLDVEYFEYPGAGHTFYNADYDSFMRRVLEFFDRNVKPNQG